MVVKVKLHTPDIGHPSPADMTLHRHRGPANSTATPTRSAGDRSSLGDRFGRMSLASAPVSRFGSHNVGSPEARVNMPGGFGSVIGNRPVSMPYIGSTTYAMSPPVPAMNTMFPGTPTFPYDQATIQRQAMYNDGSLSPLGYGSQHYPYSPIGYAQDLGYGPQSVSPRDYAQLSRSGGGRRQVIKSPQGHLIRGRHHSNSASGHHNHVDTQRIHQGIDVRTTVSACTTTFIERSGCLRYIGDASQYTKQGRSGHVEGHRG